MSAIFGIFNRHGESVVRTELERMNSALEYHGADGGGVWLHGRAGLGQRLMAFTAEDRFEHQPLISGDGRFALVCDGRIDNRAELIDEPDSRIECSASDPSTGISDSELILRAYEKWGADCLGRLTGVFAFAIWNTREQVLFIARSPILAPPIFYFVTPRVFAFSVMPKGLFALSFVPRAINERKFADMLAKSPADPDATLYRDIWRIPTGSCLTVDRNGLRVRTYWEPDLNREIRFLRDEEYVEAFNELHERVVGAQLRSLTPVGVMMSGGLDSTAVAVTAARLLMLQDKRLAAFTEVPGADFKGPVPEGRYGDETPFVRAVAGMYDNLDLNLIRTDGKTFLDDLDDLFFHLERPFGSTSNRVWIEAILKEAWHQGIGVMLNGVQGNLTFSRNGSGCIPQLLRTGKWMQALREARLLARHGSSRSILRAVVGQGIMPLLPAPLWRAVGRLRGNLPAFSGLPWVSGSPIHPDFAVLHKVGERARDWGGDDSVRQDVDSRRLNLKGLMLQDLGWFDASLRTMYSVDLRTPPADRRIAEFCLALPEEQFMHDGESRSLIRRAMAGRLPREVISNRLRGLQAADWFERLTRIRAELPAELDRLDRSDLARRMLDLARMRRMVERWPRETRGSIPHIAEYQVILERGLMAGRFLRWFESGG